MHPFVIRRPLVWAAALFCLGTQSPAEGLWVAASAALIGLSGRWWGLVVLAAFFAAGQGVKQGQRPPAETLSALKPLAERKLVFEGDIVSAPQRRPRGLRMTLDLVGVSQTPTGRLEPVKGRVQVTIADPAADCGSAGDRVRMYGRIRDLPPAMFPGGMSRQAHAARNHVSFSAFVSGASDCLVWASTPRFGFRLRVERFRDRIHQRIDETLDPAPRAVVRALATGDRSGMTSALRAAFASAGLSHLMAVSGLHLALVCGLVVRLLEGLLSRFSSVQLGLGARRWAALGGVPIVILYTLLVGAPPSAVRAALMVGALLVSHVFHRVREAWSALALALMGMAAWDPRCLEDPGLQLSFAAVASLLRIYPALLERWPLTGAPRWVRGAWDVLLASGAATLGTAPLCALHFHQLSVVGLLANVPAGPVASVGLVPLSLAGALAAGLVEPLGRPLLTGAGWIAEGLVAFAEGAAAVPGGVWHLPTPTLLECGLYLGAVLGLTSMARRPGPRRFGVLCLAGLALSVGGHEASAWLRTDVRTTFLPVGQGDAVVVELPRRRTMLVDTGPPGRGLDAVERVVLPYLRHRRIDRLDVVVLTHPHADHIGGLDSLVEGIDVGEIWWTGDLRHAPKAYAALMARLPTRKVDFRTEPWRVGPAEVAVLGPVRPAEAYHDVNDGSVVVKVSLGARAILLTGDMEAVAERDLVAQSPERLRADVLKPGHHGSRSSSSEPFLNAVRPTHAVFTLGKNNHFGFPHQVVVERLDARRVSMWRMDHHGAVTVWTDGVGLTVTPFLGGGPS